MEIGAMTILFREQLGTDEHISYTESLQRIYNAGFRAADLNLCQICGHKTKLHLDNWEEEANAVATLVQKLGLKLSQCHLPFKSKKVKWREPSDYEYYIKMFYRAIDVAAYLGIPWGVIHPETLTESGLSRSERLAANHREYDALIEYALKKNLNIAYENMLMKSQQREDNYCSSAEDLAELIDSYNDERIGACWDTGHANTYYRDDQWDALHIVGKRLHCTHIDDNKRIQDLHLLPFEGLIKWDRVIGALRDIGYMGDLILEPSINYQSPEILKDENASHAYAVMSCLKELYL